MRKLRLIPEPQTLHKLEIKAMTGGSTSRIMTLADYTLMAVRWESAAVIVI